MAELLPQDGAITRDNAVDKGLLADVYPATTDGTHLHKLCVPGTLGLSRRRLTWRPVVCCAFPLLIAGWAAASFGWRYDDALTTDENYMDLAALVARNSLCTGGHMGCVLVKDGDIISVATNTPLFQPYASDVHAEINAVSGCARHGRAMAGATAYITMPPCKHCFIVLQAAGIHRIVSRHGTLLENCTQAAAEVGIEWGVVKDDAESDRRRAEYVEAALQGDPEYQATVVAHRIARKQAKKDAYAARESRKKVAMLLVCPWIVVMHVGVGRRVC